LPETATRTRKKKANPSAPVIEPQRALELGNGLELWKVHPSALREQDVNARSMPKAMFERLSQTIGRDKRLESLPLCARTEKGLEIISGHHRTRAATAAGLSELFTLLDVTGLTRSQIAAKQLAHNAIEGQDNEQLLAEIYRQIEDADSKLEAFVDQKLDVEVPRVKIEGLDVEIDFKTVLLIFLPRVKERLDKAIEVSALIRTEARRRLHRCGFGLHPARKSRAQDQRGIRRASRRRHHREDGRLGSRSLWGVGGRPRAGPPERHLRHCLHSQGSGRGGQVGP
jgi:hypothetical protein